MDNFSEINKSPNLTMGMMVYNEEKNVAEAIESLLAQTYRNFVLIISDNASTDSTPQICKGYAQKDNRIVYIRQSENKGVLFNLRYVLEQAKTPFFMWCSGNDKWRTSFIEKLLPALKEDDDVILSYPQATMINLDGTVSDVYKEDNTTVGIDNPARRYIYFLWRFRTRISNMFYGIWRTQILKKCNLNIEVVGADMILLHEAVLEGKFRMQKEVLFQMRKPSVIKSHKETIIEQFFVLREEKIAKKATAFQITILLIWAMMKIPFYKRYQMGIITRLWLLANTLAVIVLIFFVEPTFCCIFKKILPKKNYLKLKSIWKKII